MNVWKKPRWGTVEATRAGACLACTSLMLLPMLRAAPAQVSSSVSPIFLPVLPQLKRKNPRVPILLPAFIARQQEYGPLTPDLGGSRFGYTITLSNARSRQEGKDYPDRMYWVCAISGQVPVAGEKQYPHIGKRVLLAGGVVGRFAPAGSGPSAPFATLVWHYKTGDYSLGLTHATQAELVTMANSAIQHPVLLR